MVVWSVQSTEMEVLGTIDLLQVRTLKKGYDNVQSCIGIVRRRASIKLRDV